MKRGAKGNPQIPEYVEEAHRFLLREYPLDPAEVYYVGQGPGGGYVFLAQLPGSLKSILSESWHYWLVAPGHSVQWVVERRRAATDLEALAITTKSNPETHRAWLEKRGIRVIEEIGATKNVKSASTIYWFAGHRGSRDLRQYGVLVVPSKGRSARWQLVEKPFTELEQLAWATRDLKGNPEPSFEVEEVRSLLSGRLLKWQQIGDRSWIARTPKTAYVISCVSNHPTEADWRVRVTDPQERRPVVWLKGSTLDEKLERADRHAVRVNGELWALGYATKENPRKPPKPFLAIESLNRNRVNNSAGNSDSMWRTHLAGLVGERGDGRPARSDGAREFWHAVLRRLYVHPVEPRYRGLEAYWHFNHPKSVRDRARFEWDRPDMSELRMLGLAQVPRGNPKQSTRSEARGLAPRDSTGDNPLMRRNTGARAQRVWGYWGTVERATRLPGGARAGGYGRLNPAENRVRVSPSSSKWRDQGIELSVVSARGDQMDLVDAQGGQMSLVRRDGLWYDSGQGLALNIEPITPSANRNPRVGGVELYDPREEQVRAQRQGIYESLVRKALGLPSGTDFRTPEGKRLDQSLSGEEREVLTRRMFAIGTRVPARDARLYRGTQIPTPKAIAESQARYSDPDAVLRNRQDYEETLALARKSGFYRAVLEPVSWDTQAWFVWPMPPGAGGPIMVLSEAGAMRMADDYNRTKDPRKTGRWWVPPQSTFTEEDLYHWLPPADAFASSEAAAQRKPRRSRRERR